MLKITGAAIVAFVILTFITGILYPLAVTGIAAVFFPSQARGSVIEKGGKPVGSALIGQQFDEPRYFWGRPSATAPFPYNASSSAGSNMGQSNPQLLDAVKERVSTLRNSNTENRGPVPVDMVTASGSGLDPHISPAAAEYQIPRVAKARGLDEAKVRALVAAHTRKRQFDILGEPCLNVLRLNIALDEIER